jgi:nucleotide-binding universal stress UspA family protein
MSMSISQNLSAQEKRSLTLLVPLDGSPMAESTLPVAELLASRCQVTVFLLHVMEKNAPATIHGERHLSSIGEAEDYLETTARRLTNKGMDVQLHVHPNEVGNVAGSILEHAQESNPDLVLLCTHGHGGMREVISGSIAQQVLKHGKWPVLLIPPEIAVTGLLHKLETVLVPVDRIHQHDQALAWAMTLARAFGAEIYLLLVIPTADTLYGESAVPQRFMPTTVNALLELSEKEAIDYARELAARSGSAELRVKWEVVRGDAISQIVSCTQRTGADMVVLASHGRAGVGALMEGSIVRRFIGQTTKPLLLIKID